MAETAWKARPAFAGLIEPGRHGAKIEPPGVIVRELTGRAIVRIEARRGRQSDAEAALIAALGLPAMPAARAIVWRSDFAVASAGPSAWTVAADESTSIMSRLGEPVRKAAAVVDQTDAFGTLRLAGPAIRGALAKGIAIDLDPRVFGPSRVALTQLCHLPVQLWHLDESGTYELIVPRPSAGDIWHWLIGSAAEFGILVLPA